jgi:hypothetical protein
MSGIDVNITPTSLDVYGGPTSIDVSLDYGPAGQRGSKFWVGSGNPAQLLVGQEVNVGDLFINTNTTNQFYGWLYVYVESVAGPAWETALKLNPQQYSVISTGNFNSSGKATINIKLSEITKDTVVLKNQFTVRYSMENENENPVSSSFEYDIVSILNSQTEENELFLQVVISAVKYSGSAWSNLTGNNKVHLFVSYLS